MTKAEIARSVYNRLPAQLQSVAATCYGYRMRRLRYGSDLEDRVDRILQRDKWTEHQWAEWHQRRLKRLLEIAAKHVPFYRQFWEHRPNDQWQRLENWPILNKEELRATPIKFLDPRIEPRRLREEHTSGTTGAPLHVWFDREAIREWYALFEARSRRWYGLTRHDRWAILGGQLIKPARANRPPFWIWNGALNQLYMSSYHLSTTNIPLYLDALKDYRIKHLYGYTSALYELAYEANRLGIRPPGLAVVIANAEPVFGHQRDAISKAFGCSVRETYGMSEQCGGAGECEAGQLHMWPDAGYLEVLEGNEHVGHGATGDLVFTGLVNQAMPLIRYRIGDRGALLADQQPCPCGRRLPRLARLEGRADDVLFTTRGERVGRLDPVFKHNLPIREAQIIQESVSCLRVKYVPAEGFREELLQQIQQELEARMGEVKIQFESVPAIPRTANGKFRAVINQIPADEQARLRDQVPLRS